LWPGQLAQDRVEARPDQVGKPGEGQAQLALRRERVKHHEPEVCGAGGRGAQQRRLARAGRPGQHERSGRRRQASQELLDYLQLSVASEHSSLHARSVWPGGCSPLRA
jgi:hypothetical protein